MAVGANLFALAVFVWVFVGGVGAVRADAAADRSGAPKLTLPIACTIGKDCFVQNYVDMKSGPGAVDFLCRSATYDGHKGVDFRIRSTADVGRSVAVLAAAGGTVKGRRDGMADRLIAPDGSDRSLLKGRDCGNGIVIDHGGGWETQYCHLRRGSVRVKPGETVTRGAVLGDVGYSGAASFAHVHMSVRHNGQIIDPFSGIGPGSALECMASREPSRGVQAGAGLWQDRVAQQLAYTDGVIIDAGFAGDVVEKRDLESGRTFKRPDAESSALVFFVRAINLRKGDRLAIEVKGPDGFVVRAPGKPMPRPRALWMMFTGKKLKSARWPAGAYVGRAQVVRDGRIVSGETMQLTLR